MDVTQNTTLLPYLEDIISVCSWNLPDEVTDDVVEAGRSCFGGSCANTKSPAGMLTSTFFVYCNSAA